MRLHSKSDVKKGELASKCKATYGGDNVHIASVLPFVGDEVSVHLFGREVSVRFMCRYTGFLMPLCSVVVFPFGRPIGKVIDRERVIKDVMLLASEVVNGIRWTSDSSQHCGTVTGDGKTEIHK